MWIYLPAIKSYISIDIIWTFRAFLEFCYLVCQNVITEDTITDINNALNCFHQYCEIFHSTDIISTFMLPREHVMKHYIYMIHQFGASNGLCSSIMESKHTKAIKEPIITLAAIKPWNRCSSTTSDSISLQQPVLISVNREC